MTDREIFAARERMHLTDVANACRKILIEGTSEIFGSELESLRAQYQHREDAIYARHVEMNKSIDNKHRIAMIAIEKQYQERMRMKFFPTFCSIQH
jgi:hypothetical protein